MTRLFLIVIFINSFLCQPLFAQQDSTPVKAITALEQPVAQAEKPTEKGKKKLPAGYSPRKAVIRSAIIPGWGQAYNRKYWKMPIVYGALGTSAALFFRNLKQFREARDAYILANDGDPSNDEQIIQPYYAVKDQPERIRVFRNQVRQNVDYSVLFFILIWGLNVADAAVDAHLKTFDVSENLSIQLKPHFNPATGSSGLSLVVPIGKK